MRQRFTLIFTGLLSGLGLWLGASFDAQLGQAAAFGASRVQNTTAAQNQDEQDEQDGETAEETDDSGKGGKVRVRGQLVVADPQFKVDLQGFDVTLEEILPPPKLPLPEGFQELTLPERQEWFKQFQQSPAGIAFQAELDRLKASRLLLTTKAESDGKFTFKEAKHSLFGLYGQKEFTQDGKTFVADFMAEIPVAEKLSFIELDRLPVNVRRIIKVGEDAPDLRLSVAVEGKPGGRVQPLKPFQGKPLLICFWSANSIKNMQAEIDKVIDAKLPINLLGVNLNDPGEERDTFFKETKLRWQNVLTDGLGASPLTIDYAVAALPSFWLVSADGKVMATDNQFFRALSGPEANLLDVLKKALAGESIVPPTPTPEPQVEKK